jgi:hypothetical protein
MSRRAGIDASCALHHSICRGIEQRKVFRNDTDRDEFIRRLGVVLKMTRQGAVDKGGSVRLSSLPARVGSGNGVAAKEVSNRRCGRVASRHGEGHGKRRGIPLTMRNRMKKERFKLSFKIVLRLLAVVFLVACQGSTNLIGTWQEIGTKATLEFHEDNSFRAVDNMGMAVSGKYYLDNVGTIRFEITNGEDYFEIITGNFTLNDNDLVLISSDTGETEKYRKIKQ